MTGPGRTAGARHRCLAACQLRNELIQFSRAFTSTRVS